MTQLIDKIGTDFKEWERSIKELERQRRKDRMKRAILTFFQKLFK